MVKINWRKRVPWFIKAIIKTQRKYNYIISPMIKFLHDQKIEMTIIGGMYGNN